MVHVCGINHDQPWSENLCSRYNYRILDVFMSKTDTPELDFLHLFWNALVKSICYKIFHKHIFSA